MGVSLFSHIIVIGREVTDLSCASGDSGWILGNVSSWKENGSALIQAVQGSVESPPLEVFKKSIGIALTDVM